MRFLEAIYKIFKPRKKSSVVELSAEAKSHLPGHVAVIMDGNGRWAKKRGLPRRSGHYAGGENLYNLCSWCIDFGIKYSTVFAFSTENWHRPQKEIDSLMNLFLDFFNRYEDQLAAEGVRLRFCGEIEALPAKVQETIKKAEKQSIERDKLHLIVAFNYGGRREIVRTAQKLICKCQTGQLTAELITEDVFADHLYLPDVPDPDLIIRPSGELRLSNFLLWQSAYSEFWFSDVLWPDFSQDDFAAAINDYASRQRRFGGVK